MSARAAIVTYLFDHQGEDVFTLGEGVIATLAEAGFAVAPNDQAYLDGRLVMDSKQELADAVMRLRAALKTSWCPRPSNGAPDLLTVEECMERGECGCDSGEALAGPMKAPESCPHCLDANDCSGAAICNALNEVITNGHWTEGEGRGEWAISKEVYETVRDARDAPTGKGRE